MSTKWSILPNSLLSHYFTELAPALGDPPTSAEVDDIQDLVDAVQRDPSNEHDFATRPWWTRTVVRIHSYDDIEGQEEKYLRRLPASGEEMSDPSGVLPDDWTIVPGSALPFSGNDDVGTINLSGPWKSLRSKITLNVEPDFSLHKIALALDPAPYKRSKTHRIVHNTPGRLSTPKSTGEPSSDRRSKAPDTGTGAGTAGGETGPSQAAQIEPFSTNLSCSPPARNPLPYVAPVLGSERSRSRKSTLMGSKVDTGSMLESSAATSASGSQRGVYLPDHSIVASLQGAGDVRYKVVYLVSEIKMPGTRPVPALRRFLESEDFLRDISAYVPTAPPPSAPLTGPVRPLVTTLTGVVHTPQNGALESLLAAQPNASGPSRITSGTVGHAQAMLYLVAFRRMIVLKEGVLGIELGSSDTSSSALTHGLHPTETTADIYSPASFFSAEELATTMPYDLDWLEPLKKLNELGSAYRTIQHGALSLALKRTVAEATTARIPWPEEDPLSELLHIRRHPAGCPGRDFANVCTGLDHDIEHLAVYTRWEKGGRRVVYPDGVKRKRRRPSGTSDVRNPVRRGGPDEDGDGGGRRYSPVNGLGDRPNTVAGGAAEGAPAAAVKGNGAESAPSGSGAAGRSAAHDSDRNPSVDDLGLQQRQRQRPKMAATAPTTPPSPLETTTQLRTPPDPPNLRATVASSAIEPPFTPHCPAPSTVPPNQPASPALSYGSSPLEHVREWLQAQQKLPASSSGTYSEAEAEPTAVDRARDDVPAAGSPALGSATASEGDFDADDPDDWLSESPRAKLLHLINLLEAHDVRIVPMTPGEMSHVIRVACGLPLAQVGVLQGDEA